MRTKFLLLASVAVTAVAVFAVRPVEAGDYVYADSFGNLVINSATGYKRIVVGQGYRAAEIRESMGAKDPSVVYADEAPRNGPTVIYINNSRKGHGGHHHRRGHRDR